MKNLRPDHPVSHPVVTDVPGVTRLSARNWIGGTGPLCYLASTASRCPCSFLRYRHSLFAAASAGLS